MKPFKSWAEFDTWFKEQTAEGLLAGCFGILMHHDGIDVPMEQHFPWWNCGVTLYHHA